jgi:hypothetical protein
MKVNKTIVIAGILIGLGSYYSYACKCAYDPTITESFKGSTLVVHGRVVNKKLISFAETMRTSKANEVKERLKTDQQTLQLFETDYVFEIKLEVVENFKGSSIRDTLTIYTTMSSGSCGYKFDLAKDYIVYASKKSFHYSMFLTASERKDNFEKENTYWVHRCMRTSEYHKPEANELRKIKNELDAGH